MTTNTLQTQKCWWLLDPMLSHQGWSWKKEVPVRKRVAYFSFLPLPSLFLSSPFPTFPVCPFPEGALPLIHPREMGVLWAVHSQLRIMLPMTLLLQKFSDNQTCIISHIGPGTYWYDISQKRCSGMVSSAGRYGILRALCYIPGWHWPVKPTSTTERSWQRCLDQRLQSTSVEQSAQQTTRSFSQRQTIHECAFGFACMTLTLNI